MRLPSQQALVQRSQLIWRHVETFAEGRAADPLVWSNMPRLGSTAYIHMAEHHDVPRKLGRLEVRRMCQAQVAERKGGPGQGATYALGGDCLFLASTPNMRRAQAPLHEQFGPLRPPSPEIRPPPRRTRSLVRAAASLAGELIACAQARQVKYPLDSEQIYKQFLRSARLLGYWEDLVRKEAPRAVVLPSVWAPPARALLYAARQAGIPTVHVPDAALRTDWDRPGLPVDYVALRGEKEADYLAGRGIDWPLLDVVGHPAIAPQAPPALNSSLPPAFAPSSEKHSQLVPVVEVVHEALGEDVIVGRHPNPAADEAPLPFPPGWRLFDGRTYELLKAGAPVVIQQSSGVALEALHLGIPVIELKYPGKTTHFPWIREPYVRVASTSEELRAAVAASAQASDPAHRQTLIDWARGWAGPTGEEAGKRAVALVERARAEGARGPIRDTWS